MKKVNLKYMLWMMFILILSSCKDEVVGTSVEEGLLTKLNISIEVPEVETITNTRSVSENESKIKELILLFYSQNSDLNYGIDLSGSLTENSSDGKIRYLLNSPIPVKTGTFRIYAIANWSSSFGNVNIDVNSVPNEDELKNLIANNNENIKLSDSEYLPMTEVLSEQTIYQDANENNLKLKLKRITARIEFTIENGANLTSKNGKFVPQTYQIMNLPRNSSLFEQENKIESKNLFNSQVITFDENSSTFEFLMNENVCDTKNDITVYTQRDLYNGNWFEHNFTNAPENSTYVVITGMYEDNTSKATVNYLIHLGNFSETGSLGNFTVNRNELHKYKVTINGIDNVTTSVEVKNPGAYSDDKVDKKFEFKTKSAKLDAHYVIYPITINTENVDKWVVESDCEWLTLTTNLTDLAKLGYWIREDRGSQRVEGVAPGTTTIYAYLDENAANDAIERTATLTLYKDGFKNNNAQITISQHPVVWIDETCGTGVIEENTSNWGFKWTKVVTLQSPGLGWTDFKARLAYGILSIFGGVDFYVFQENYWNVTKPLKITIDYTLINELGDLGTDSDNGRQNTFDLFSFKHVDYVSQFENTFVNIGMQRSFTGDDVDMEKFAARFAIKKNAFVRVIEEDSEGNTVEYATLENGGTIEGAKWYLPSENEYKKLNEKLKDTEFALTQDFYWTSTGINDNQNARAFSTLSGESVNAERINSYPIHCMRVKE